MLDFAITGGSIVDGTGSKAYPGDLGIEGERIAEIGNLSGANAAVVVKAEGMVVAPGFIDVHSHHDLYLVDQDPVLRFESFLRQGVTTSVVGNCGWTLAPCSLSTRHILLDLIRSMGVPLEQFHWNSISEYLSYIEQQGLICNVAHLVGHGAIRISVMGEQNRFCTIDELNRMKELVKESMEAGCIGLSTGLMYYPGIYAHTDELIALAEVAGEYGRPYVSHLRGYCTTLPDALAEAITIAEKARVAIQISHLLAVPFLGRLANTLYDSVNFLETVNSIVPLPGLPNPALEKGLSIIQNAMDNGIDIGVDAIPYVLGNSTITVLFPPWANKGGKVQLLERLKNPVDKRRMEKDILAAGSPKWPHWEGGSWADPLIRALGWRTIRVLSVKNDRNRWTEGKTFVEIGKQLSIDPFSALCRLTLEEDAEVAFTVGYAARPWIEKVFNKTLSHPLVSIGADSILPQFGAPPPSAYGCFPRVLGHYCRDLGLFSLEEAVKKMTSLSASRYKLNGRGELKKGAFADVVVFDPGTVKEKFTEEGIPTFAEGISHVFINGLPMVMNGEFRSKLRPGKLLRN